MGEASNCTERGSQSLPTEQGLLALKANIDVGHTMYLLMKIQSLVAALRSIRLFRSASGELSSAMLYSSERYGCKIDSPSNERVNGNIS
jgi:hypothetical protein